VQGTLLLAVLTTASSYARELEQEASDLPDTLQWWIGSETWRIRTYALDHDIHTHLVSKSGQEALELALGNNAKHYAAITREQHVIEIPDGTDGPAVARALAALELAPFLEVAERFAFWKPDDAPYRTQSSP
jgi:hypothetical protein